MKPRKLLMVLLVAGITALVTINSGCIRLAPGADPLVVRTEQVMTIAPATFDLVLRTEHANRPFWKTNAPAFHAYCEWLRQPRAIQVSGTNMIVSRDIAMVWQLNEIKKMYQQANKGFSNQVIAAMVALEGALREANGWLLISTNNSATR